MNQCRIVSTQPGSDDGQSYNFTTGNLRYSAWWDQCWQRR